MSGVIGYMFGEQVGKDSKRGKIKKLKQENERLRELLEEAEIYLEEDNPGIAKKIKKALED